MAKKSVATLKGQGGKAYAKVIRPVKSDITGAYSFKEELVLMEEVQNVIKKK